jgi:hypothetical protein
MRIITLAILMVAALSAADLDNNTVTVTATRSNAVQPDQAQVLLQLNAAQGAGLDDVLGTLKGTSVVAANLSNVTQEGDGTVTWTFLLPVALTSLKSTLAALAQLDASLGSSHGSHVLNYSVIGTQVSADAQAAQPCPLPALVSDARKQADALAAAAGMKTGPIVSVSDEPPTAQVATSSAVLIAGDFSAILPVSGLPYVNYAALSRVLPVPAPPSCSLTVQFRLQ